MKKNKKDTKRQFLSNYDYVNVLYVENINQNIICSI